MKKVRKQVPSSALNDTLSFENMIVTLDELKENRDKIISHILDVTTSNNVAKVMTEMVDRLGSHTCFIKLANDCMIDLGLFDQIGQEMAEDTLRRNKQLMAIR